jgi:magnesium transporter
MNFPSSTILGDLSELKSYLNALPPADAGDYLVGVGPEDRPLAFRLLNKDTAISAFEYLPIEIQEELIGGMQQSQLIHILESMSPDDRALLFDELPASVVKRLLSQLSQKERDATAVILGYDEGTAGRLMTTEYVRLRQGLTVEEAVLKIRAQDQDKETVYYAYVTDDNRTLVSVVSLRQLLFSIPSVLVRDIASTKILSVTTTTLQEEVARVMKRYDLLALPVVDKESRLVGIVTIDDVIDVLEEEATEDIERIVGLSGDGEGLLTPPSRTAARRLPWLLGNIVLYVGAASVIAPFQGEISAIPLIAILMPILSNTSGNVGIQALTVTIRALAVGEVSTVDTLRIVKKEALAALIMATGLGVVLMILGFIWADTTTRWVAVTAGGVLSLNIVVAATVGTLLPMLLKRFGFDPALVSGPLLTTILDTVGFLTFLSSVSLLR